MDNSVVRSGKFVCPKDFTEIVNTEGLCHEDIDDDSELFIIQAPVDADLKKLHDQQLVLSEPTIFCYSAENGKEEMYKCTTAAVDSQFAKACLILPERNSLKLCAAEKGIEGVIYIEKRVAFPQICYPKELYDKAKTPVNLKKRADPLSSGNSTVLFGDYDKKGASEDSTEDLPRADDLSSQRGRKKKHNRHIIQDENPPEDIPVKSKKKHKQSRRDQVTHIQDEAFSDPFLEGAKSKNKTPMDPEHVDSQMSHSDDINSKHFASTKKKKKRGGGGDDTSREVEESELSEKWSEAGSREHSPQKRNKKKDKFFNSSVSDPHFVDSQEQKKKNGKAMNDKSKISSEENHNNQSSSSSYASNYKIKEEMEDHVVEGNSSYTNQHNGINSGELSSRTEKKTKKMKKKVNSDDQNSGADLSNIEIKEEIMDDYILQGNSSCMDSPNELSPDKKRKSKKKKKKKDDS